MSKFTYETEIVDGAIVLRLSGNIDEDVDFNQLNLDFSHKQLVIDLEGVTRLNSTGIRSWVLWVRSIPSGVIVMFRNCHQTVVDQMNILNGFMPMGAIIESFYVPYYCESCGNYDKVLAKRGVDYKEGTSESKEGILVKEHIKCSKCGEEMEWDIIPEKYFTFLKYRR